MIDESRSAIARGYELLRELFDAAVAAADPARLVAPALPPAPRGRTIVIGAGKAAAAMARAVEAEWSHPLEGLVVTRYGHALPTRAIAVIEAGHPVPDAAGLEASERIAALVSDLRSEDLVLGLFSGGGSALLALPPPGLTLEDLQAVNRALLGSGAGIHEMNCVRKHLSQLQGGRLAARCAPARLVTLLISDVPGDDPATIASGPTVADTSTCADALRILDRFRVEVPQRVRAFLQAGTDETIKPDDPRLARARVRIIASAQLALEAAARRAHERGVQALILGDRIEGEAREVGRAHAAIARKVATSGQPVPRPCVLLSGGETTVTVRHAGRGGRNAEYLLGAMLALDGLQGVHALAADTDGIDGTEDNAGARCAPDSLARAHALGLDPQALLDANDSYGLFAALDDLVVTGPTRTNVNDFRALLIV
jgi:hydroxypyruvate reductase